MSTTAPTTVQTITTVLDGQTVTVDQADCANCGERVARGSLRGTRAWRHMLTLSGLCASGESVADPR